MTLSFLKVLLNHEGVEIRSTNKVSRINISRLSIPA